MRRKNGIIGGGKANVIETSNKFQQATGGDRGSDGRHREGRDPYHPGCAPFLLVLW